MTVVNGSLIRSASAGFRAIFKQGLSQAKPKHGPYIEETTSDGASEQYLFGGGIPGLGEIKDKLEFQSLSLHDILVTNRDYGLGLSIPRNAFADDKLGVFRPQIQMMGVRAAYHPTELWASLLAGGFTTTKCYDGKTLFATDHPRVAGGVQSNKGTAVLSSAAFQAGVKALRLITDERKQPLGLVDMARLHLVVPPSLESTAESIVKARTLANGADNPDYGKADVVVVEQLEATSATAWFLALTGLPLRPFILQMREKPDFVAKDQPSDDNVLFDRELLYAVQGRWAMAPAMWQVIYGSTGA